MGLEITGLEALERKLRGANAAAKKKQFLQQEAEFLITGTKALTPVDTGYLRNGWRLGSISSEEATVANNTEYAAHVEYGHRVKAHGKYTGRVVKGRYMFRDAMEAFRPDFAKDIERLIGEMLR